MVLQERMPKQSERVCGKDCPSGGLWAGRQSSASDKGCGAGPAWAADEKGRREDFGGDIM